ncbi:MAG: c-type cytochrome domain-containing protein [Pirellulales bacterium]
MSVSRTIPLVACDFALSCLALSVFAARARADDPVSFSKQIAPILVKNCQACHGATEAESGYQVTNYNLVIKAGESESPSITPGKTDESELLARISSDDADARMPQEADPLPAEQIELVKRWIAEGAKFDGPDPAAALASIIPKTAEPDPPQAYHRPVPIAAIAFNHDGRELAVGGYHEVTIWNVESGSLARRIKNVAERVYGLDYNADGSLVAVAGGMPASLGEVKLFNPADGTLVKDLALTADVAFCAAFNPAGTKLAVGGADRAIRIFDVAGGKQEVLIEDHADWVVRLAWSPDGTKLASASRDKTSKLFNAEKGESLVTYSGHGEQLFGVAFSGDGKLVFTAGADKKIHAWNPDDGGKKGELGGFGGEVLALVTQADKIIGGSADKTVAQHRVEGFKQFKTYGGHTDAVYSVAYHPGTGRVAAGSFSGEVRIWNAEDGAQVSAFIAAPGYAPPTPPVAAAK